jgi:hypothetical protein
MLAILALNLWLVLVAVRTKFGSGLWNNRGLSLTYTVITLAAMGFLTMTGCESAHITSTVSPFDPLWQLLGINLDKSLVFFPQVVSYGAIAFGIVLAAAALALALRWRKHRVN